MKYSVKKDLIVFLILLVICICSVFLLYSEYNVDFFNYQYYNVWALLNNRYNIDFMAADFRTYWNPYLDFIQYFLVNTLNHHKFLYVIASILDDVLALFLVYKIADKILSDNIKNRNLSLFLLIFYVIYSPVMFIISCDCTRNDMYITDLILITFYILLKTFNQNDENTKKFCLAGCLMGISVGLKLTSAIYGLTFLLCLIFLNKSFKNPFKNISVFLSSMILSFFVVDGYWLFKIYSLFKNPFFPIFNDIFHSPYADSSNVYFGDYECIRPHDLKTFLLYPFLWGKHLPYGFLQRSWDLRYAINVICLIILFTGYFKNHYFPVKNRNYMIFLIFYCFFSYEIGVFVFGMYRYLTATSLLYGLILFLTVYYLISNIKFMNNVRVTTVMLFMIVLTIVTQEIFYYTIEKGRLFLERDTVLKPVTNYNIEDNSIVLILCMGITEAMTHQNKNAQYIHFTYPKFIYPYFYERHRHYEFENDIVYFKNYYYFSDYLEYLMHKTLKSDKKIYIYMKLPEYVMYFDIINDSIGFYSNGTRVLENCSKFDSNTEGRKGFYNVMCEVNKK